MLEKKYFEFESRKDPNLQIIWNLNLRIFRLPFSLSQKMFPDFAPESPLSQEKILFAIFSLLFEIPPSHLFKRFKGEAIATSHYFL